MRLWPQQNATRRGNGTLTRFAFAKGIKDSELFLGCATFWFIRARKMADDIHRLTNVFALGQAMDMICVDLGPQAQDKAGDPVILWGEGLPVERIAEMTKVSAYELITRLTSRVAMKYVD